ncbi:UbiD family decarboxylase [Algisphaera agarilytica]|uniref:4-hydroxy-3-polyprenylbenzoate decarboxylase n=1 Tax=Algisphaera agarilytica TaxID=1385975 RepID=A0A7X0LL67_9BACT|nr:UbiD family decarboxylase domain-containing protein [Algisphaera agarilytica]MBB6431190.1 4-hydroxy-3-polyprenylbenzoate decarboxylase [Algisphaera agarilytica]
MTYSNLRTFVEALESAGELRRISVPVSSMLEITEIADRVSKSPAASVSEFAKDFDPHHADLGGSALLFENVQTPEGQAKFPLLINAFGSYRRMEMAMGCAEASGASGGGFDGLAERVASLVKPEPPSSLMEKVKKGVELAKVAGQVPPKVVKSGLCQEVVKVGDEINLFDLPIIKCWPDDGDPRTCGYGLSPEKAGTAQGQGRYITLAGMYTIHPDDAGKPDGDPRPSRNVGMYRAQLLDRNHTAMHWHMHHDGASHWRAWKKHNTAKGDHTGGMPCAIVLGGESVLPYSATAPLPPGISELMFAGFLNQGSIKLVKCKTVDMHVPANAEIVIEGYVSTEAGPIGYDPRPRYGEAPPDLGPGAVFEGPFGDHTGFYSLPDRYPVFTVTAITHREKPIYPTTIVGRPPQEDYYLGKATERVFLPLLKTLIPDIIDYDLPMFGCFHNCAFIKIKKEYPLQARRVMHAVWGAGQMAWTKSIVVVDDDVNVHDHEEVLFHLLANADPGRDIEFANGPLDILDHAAPRLGAGTKIGLDATRKIPGEEVNGNPVRDWPTILNMSDDIRQRVSERWSEYGL